MLYIDSLLAFELAADFTLLWASARLCALRFKLWRGILAALFGALYSLGAVFLQPLSGFPLKLCAAGVMVLIAFGGEKRLWKPALSFLAASALFAGLCLALSFMGEGKYSFRTLLISLGLTLGLCAIPFRFIGAKRAGTQLLTVRLTGGGREKELTALRDTGNRLREPVSGGPVLVAHEAELYELLPEDKRRVFEETAGLSPTERYLRLGSGFRLVPYRAVGVKGGLLLAFKPEAVYVKGRKKEGLWAALSPTEIGRGEGYTALVNGDIE